MSSLTPEERRPLLISPPEYIDAAFRAIETRCGSIDMFLRSKLNVDEDEHSFLKGHLLENV